MTQREGIDIRWIPDAKECWIAVQNQIKMLEESLERTKQTRDRYSEGTFMRISYDWRVRHQEETLKILRANLEGKTVAQ